jgi:hypothetical protein
MLNQGSDENASGTELVFAVAVIMNAKGKTEETPMVNARILHAINFFSISMIHLHPTKYINEPYNSPRRTQLFS